MVNLALIIAYFFGAIIVCALSANRALACAFVCGRRGFVTGAFVCANGISTCRVGAFAASRAFVSANMFGLFFVTGTLFFASFLRAFLVEALSAFGTLTCALVFGSDACGKYKAQCQNKYKQHYSNNFVLSHFPSP